MTFASTVAAQVADLLGISRQDASQLVNDALQTLGMGADGRHSSSATEATEDERVSSVVEVAVSAHFERANASAASASTSDSSPQKKRRRTSASTGSPANMQQKTMGAFFALPPGKAIKTQRTVTSLMKAKRNHQTNDDQAGGVKQEEDITDEVIEILDEEPEAEDTEIGIEKEDNDASALKRKIIMATSQFWTRNQKEEIPRLALKRKTIVAMMPVGTMW